MDEITFRPIGTIYTPFKEPVGMPIQTSGGLGVKGTIKIDQEFIPALKDLEGFSHIILLYYFHRSKGYSNEVIPFLNNRYRGVFSTRAPRRPNNIGLSVVRLMKITEGTLFVENLDIIDETPLLDIKPYVPAVDSVVVDRIGWLEGKENEFLQKKANENFQ
jgi:tRNA-Thr(GGU) m(6)t(6)A37 methyltransferase TsaA